jgi:phosphoheptose isomerase
MSCLTVAEEMKTKQDWQSVVVVVLSKACSEENNILTFTVNGEKVDLIKIAKFLCGKNRKKLSRCPKIFFLLAESVLPSNSTDNFDSKEVFKKIIPPRSDKSIWLRSS